MEVWIIEDNEGFRKTVTRAINQSGSLRCVQAFGSCEAALARLRSKVDPPPAVILLDVSLPGMTGIEGVRKIKELYPGIEVIMVTVFDDGPTLMQAIAAGASGYLLITASPQMIIDSIVEVTKGGAPMSPSIARSMVNLFSRFAPAQSDYGLSPREKEALDFLVQGLTKKEIAERMNLSYHTVDKHVRGIYEKLHVKNAAAAVAKAMGEKS